MNANESMLLATLVIAVPALFVLALAETSLVHVRRSAVVVAAEAGDRRAAALVRLLDDLPRVMNGVLLVVLLAQVTAATAAGVLARNWFGSAGVGVATALVTVVLFVYGEAIPKTIAVRRPLHVARRLATPLRWLSGALRPVVSVLVGLADLQTRGRGIDAVSAVSEAELRHLAGHAASVGRIDESDAALIERSFAFGDLRVADIVVPRADVVAVAGGTRVDDALRIAIAAGHRRLPVFEGGIDHIIGFVRMRDLADAVSVDPGAPVVGRVRPLLTVSAAESVVALLRLMQQSGRHLAVVVGREGAADGIVTIEDVVEELVGSIEER